MVGIFKFVWRRLVPQRNYLAQWKDEISRSPNAIYLTLADSLALSIRKGDLQEGDKLPPQRIIADYLGTNLTTVPRAFTEAR
ncbi:MAG: GntR family transcriptional regulator, partial [Acetobacter syzygii]